MEFKFRGLKVGLPDGVDNNKFGALLPVAVTPDKVKEVFEKYGYDLSEVPGVFLKTFSMNEKELAEVEANLVKIERMGMKNTFENNLRLRYFRSGFMVKLEKCIQAGLPYLNPDNTFAAFFDSEEAFEAYMTRRSVLDNKENIEIQNNVNKETPQFEMSPEDKQVYNEIVKSLNYLVLANPMDTGLATVVNNAINKVVDAILRKEYKFLGIREMVESVMFDGIDVTPEDNERITNLVLGAFPDEERKMA